MNKKLRTKFQSAFAAKLEATLPEYVPIKLKSKYVWPGETVWAKEAPGCTYFVILSPEPKGQRDEVTVELGWSRQKRFPECSQRPSIFTPTQIQGAGQVDEGTIRLGRACPEYFGFVPVDEEKLDEVVDFLIGRIVDFGAPFLESL